MNGTPANIDASVITVPLDRAFAALRNKIEREWPQRYATIPGAREIVLLNVATTDVTSRSILFLCAEKPPDSNRLLEYSLSAPPLNRTILDNLFSLIFLLEDLPVRCLWYHKSAWREQRLELDRCVAEYGSAPNWQEWLKDLRAFCDFGVRLFQISPQEIANPKQIPSWPNAGAMATYGVSESLRMAPNRVPRDCHQFQVPNPLRPNAPPMTVTIGSPTANVPRFWKRVSISDIKFPPEAVAGTDRRKTRSST